jgi:hypothetical protein
LLHVRTVAANATNKLDAETLRINTLYEDKVKQDADIQQNRADIVELQGEMATKAHAWSTLETASVKPTLQDNVLSADVKVDPSTANIIKVNTNGIIAQVTLSYDQTTNTLTFNNGMAQDSWKLMNNSLIEDAYYNKSGELILVIKNANGSTEEIKVQLDRMIGGTKDGSPIIVNINTDEATGSRVVTADLNISTDDRNLLSSGGALFASKMASDHYGTYNEEEHTMQEILGMIKEDIRLASNAPLESRVITLEAKVLALETAISQLIDFGTYEADDNEEATE